MNDEQAKNRTFEIVDSIYNELVQKEANQELLDVLLKAAKALDEGMPYQKVAAKLINSITMYVLTDKFYFGDNISKELAELKMIARSGGYKYFNAGVGDLRVNFFN